MSSCSSVPSHRILSPEMLAVSTSNLKCRHDIKVTTSNHRYAQVQIHRYGVPPSCRLPFQNPNLVYSECNIAYTCLGAVEESCLSAWFQCLSSPMGFWLNFYDWRAYGKTTWHIKKRCTDISIVSFHDGQIQLWKNKYSIIIYQQF